MDKLRSFELFAGIGGFALGLEATGHFETVGFCENDPYARAVLRKHWPGVPLFGDIKELGIDQIKERCGRPNILTGGYPCQPYSQAGKRRGHEDDRDLWPEMFRLVKGLRPDWVLGENVIGHITLGLDRTISDLEAEGYAVRSFVIPACAVDAPHQRARVWIVAHAEPTGTGHKDRKVGDKGRRAAEARSATVRQRNGASVPSWADATSEALADAEGQPVGAGFREGGEASERRRRSGDSGCAARGVGCEGQSRSDTVRSGLERIDEAWAEAPSAHRPKNGRDPSRWPIEPSVGRVAYGVPARVDRIKCLGNAVVPQVVARIGLAIAHAHRQAILDRLGGKK